LRVALFDIHSYLAGTYSLFGFRETLKELGHEVSEFPFPGNAIQNVPAIAATMPTITQLNEFDVVLVTYFEYVQPWLKAVYGFESWKCLRVPVIARFDESMDRGDLMLPSRVPELLQWANHYSFPGAQDAEKYKGHWHPCGADTSIFYPDPETPKKYDVGFIGTLYAHPLANRQEYLQKLMPHVGKRTRVYCGGVLVQDIEGPNGLETAKRLAHNYRQIKIFFHFPPASRLLVEKAMQVIACDTLVMYPRFPDNESNKNLSILKHGKHIIYYDLGYYAQNGIQVKHLMENPEQVAEIAKAGGAYVREHHTLRKMMESIMALADGSKVEAAAG